MFAYYLKSLHKYHEQNLNLNNETAKASISLLLSLLEGHYLIQKAMLHQRVTQMPHRTYGNEPYLAIQFDEGFHEDSFKNWIDSVMNKSTHMNHLVIESFQHPYTGLNSITGEFLANLKRDLPKEFSEELDSIRLGVESLTEAEVSLLSAVERMPATKMISKRLNPSSKSQRANTVAKRTRSVGKAS